MPKKYNKICIIIISILIILTSMQHYTYAVPVGPNVTLIKNETATPAAAAIVNTTGGSITTMVLDATTQNLKWKAFVGNVTGTLVLADASDYSIFNWELTTVIGEVYATRSLATVSWANINCSNITHIINEEIALNHTSNPNDNISTTFNTKNHSSFYTGTVEINQNDCYSIHTNVNNQSQNISFEEILLYDGTNSTNGDVVYATIFEQDTLGYNNESYDFQMIVPEVGLHSWTSSTAYYFYVELT